MPAIQNAVPLIPRTVLFDNPERAQPKISPDGARLAFLKPENGVMNVFVGDRESAENGEWDRFVAVTDDRKRGIALFFWQQDSAHILYTQDEGGDENWRLYQTAIASRTTRNLTPFEKVQARVVSIDPRFPETALLALNHRDPRLHDLYEVDLRSGQLTLREENTDGFADYSVDNCQQVRSAQKMLSDGSTDIFYRETNEEPWRVIAHWSADDTGEVVGFTPDDSRLLLLTSYGANASRLIEMDPISGQETVLAEDQTYDVASVLMNPVTHQVEVVGFDRARLEWQVLAEAVREDFERLMAERDGVITLLSRDTADRIWTVAYLTDNGPTHFYLYYRDEKTLYRLFSDRPALEPYTLASVTPVSFPARDGLTLQGYLTLPPGVEPVDLPMVLWVHGGPWARDSWRFSAYVQLLANRGYAVLQINFRGSRGYGKAFMNAGDREWGAKMQDDLLDGKVWAAALGIADLERVAIAGGSYGGYATLAGLAFTPEEFACGIDIVGPSNLNTLLASIPPYWEPIKALFTKRMGDDEAFLTERSPLFKVDQICRPLLIAQGANDPRVKIAESDQMVSAMRAAGKPVEYIVFPDEGHGFRRPENSLYFTARMEAFLAQYLNGRAEPVTDIPGSSGEVR